MADKLHDLATGLENRGVSGLIEEVQDFARRRPGAFILSTAIVGFAGGRLLRSAKSDDDESSYPEASPRSCSPSPGTDRAAPSGSRLEEPRIVGRRVMAQTRYAYREPSDRSTQDLLSYLSGQVGALLRQEVELAKIETKEQLTRAGKAGAMFGAAGVAGFMALLLLPFAAAWGLAAVLPDGLAFLIVGVVYAVAAAVLLASGRKKAEEISVVPQQTVQTLKEDAQWARAQRR